MTLTVGSLCSGIGGLELGPRIAIPWASGRTGCVTDLSTPDAAPPAEGRR